MTNSLSDLLANKWEEPEEIKIIKDFVRKKFNAQAGVKLQDKTIAINVDNASLAGALRLNLNELKEKLNTDKKLVIKIS
ncbi:MAG: hypothetical protein ACXWLH_01660 [Candidatus Saccharimonadales bacterium]